MNKDFNKGNDLSSVHFDEDVDNLDLQLDTNLESVQTKSENLEILDIDLNQYSSEKAEEIKLDTELEPTLELDLMETSEIVTLDNSEELELDLGDLDEVSAKIVANSGGVNLGSMLGNFLIKPEEEISEEELRLEEAAEGLALEVSVPDLEVYAKEGNIEESTEIVKESEERSKKLLINNLNKVRKTISPAESREALANIYNSSVEQTKEYINNIYNGFTLNTVKQQKTATHVTNNLSVHGSGKFFSLLVVIYQQICIEASAENKPTMSTDEFMQMDLKHKLLSYGGRLGELSDSVESMDKVTASDVLNAEYLVVKLRAELDNVRENVEHANAITDTEKTALSGIRTQLTRRYTPKTLGNTRSEYAYVAKLRLVGDKEEFVCGHCGKISTAKQPFYLLGVLPFQGRVKVNSNSYQAIDLPSANECEHCKTLNILTEEEVKRLSKATIKLHKALLDDYCKSVRALCSSFAMTRYRCSNEILWKTLPNLQIDESEFEAEDELEEVATDSMAGNLSISSVGDNEIDAAYKRYRDMIGYFETSADFKEYPTEEELADIININDVGTRFIPNTDIEGNRKIESRPAFKSNLANTVKVLCATLGVKYNDARRNALNSIIMNIRNSKLYSELAYSTTEVEKIILDSKNIVNYLDDLDDTEKPQIIGSLCGLIDYKYSDIVDENTMKVLDSELPKFKSVVNDYFAEHEVLVDKLAKRKKKLINDLKDNIRIYAFVPLATIPVLTDADDLLFDDEFIDFVEETADLMLLMNLAERFFKYWKTILSKTDVNAFSFLADVNKTNNFDYCIKLLDRIGLYKFQPRSKTTDKERMLLEVFTLLRDIDFEQLAKLDGVRQAYQDGDMFTLMHKIKDCEFMNSLMGYDDSMSYVYDTAIYKPIRQMITALLPIAENFISKYGNSDEDRLRFYLKNLFSEEEIVSVNAKRYRTIKFNILLNKEEGETITEYLKRLSEIAAKAPTENVLPFTFEYQEEVDNYSVLLLGCSYPLMFLENNVKQIKEILTVIDLLYQINQRSLGKIMEIMRIDIDVANKLISETSDLSLKRLNKQAEDAKNYLLRSIFLVNAFNFSGNIADIDVANDNADTNIDLGASDEDRLKVILADADKFEEASKHLPEEVIKLINEHYTIGR